MPYLCEQHLHIQFQYDEDKMMKKKKDLFQGESNETSIQCRVFD